ncbi:Lrp/AsnC family transcriptional regulator [Clostridium hydrogenum]|uniref:Lrp/AsnC family transcriptional regulator n=1 Tax=Clostridium hydrogenum TaxID=2855764 RepID=UPI001F2FDBDB|nr:AsnC family transcriptional regulator [Clostridium hydrogenum]
MLDQTDLQILNLLKKNSRMQWREIGKKVHMTGQAVKNRIDKMEKLQVIKGYTVKVNSDLDSKKLICFVTVFMKTTNHAVFKKYVEKNDLIVEANRISGEGCYLLKLKADTKDEVVSFLDEILKYGNYKINSSIEVIK